jgi:hypothetical protein
MSKRLLDPFFFRPNTHFQSVFMSESIVFCFKVPIVFVSKSRIFYLYCFLNFHFFSAQISTFFLPQNRSKMPKFPLFYLKIPPKTRFIPFYIKIANVYTILTNNRPKSVIFTSKSLKNAQISTFFISKSLKSSQISTFLPQNPPKNAILTLFRCADDRRVRPGDLE